MANHFTLSRAARDFDEDAILRRSDRQVFDEFVARVFEENGGKPVCPHCNGDAISPVKNREMLSCKPCRRQFSPRKGTEQYKKKVSLYKYDKAVLLFTQTAWGISAAELARRLHVEYKTAYRLLQKIRNGILPGQSLERYACDVKEGLVERLDKPFDLDGTEIGGFMTPKNVKKTKNDHRKMPGRSKEKETGVVVKVRGTGEPVLVSVHKHEGHVKPFLFGSVKRDTIIYADKASTWSDLGSRFDLRQVNHKVQYASPWSNNNAAESTWSQAARAELGVYVHVSGIHLLSYLGEVAWRLQHNRVSNRTKFDKIRRLLMKPLRASPKFNRNVKRKMRKEGRAKEYFALREVAAAQARAVALAA